MKVMSQVHNTKHVNGPYRFGFLSAKYSQDKSSTIIMIIQCKPALEFWTVRECLNFMDVQRTAFNNVQLYKVFN